MPLSHTQENAISYIMGLTYEQYGCPWCKMQPLEEMQSLCFGKNKSLVAHYLTNPPTIESQQTLIQVFLSEVLYNYTPESFLYYEMLKYIWLPSNAREHDTVLAKMQERLDTSLEKYKAKAQAALLEYLSYWGLNNREEYENAPEEIKAQVNLANFPNIYGYRLEGIPDDNFSDYPALIHTFSTEVFDKNSVQFFVNVLPNDIEAFWEKGEMPAVIGIDNQMIGLFWWND
ncbi:MAG: hypothetical protein ACKVTZ_02810 [Bacteroidia bacterium]